MNECEKMLSENREFYDLCRKYKYYYNAYKQVEHLKDIYWSKYIRDAYKEVEFELQKVEDEIIFKIFEKILGKYPKIEVERIHDDRFWGEYGIPNVIGEKIILDEPKFCEYVQKYIKKIVEEEHKIQ